MKKITLIFIGLFCIVTLLNAQNTDPKTYFNGHFVGGLADDGDIIWVGVDSLLVKMEKASGATIASYTVPKSSAFPDSDRYVLSISLDNTGLAWVTCFIGQTSILSPGTYLETFNGEKSWVEMPLPNPYFSQLIIDNENKVWASSLVGLHRYDGKGWVNYQPGSYFTTAFAVDNQNNKWLGLANIPMDPGPGFLAKFDGTQFTLYNPLATDSVVIYSIDFDPMGIVWVGTYENGLIKFDGTNWEFYNSSNSGLPEGPIGIVKLEGANIIWMSTQDGLTRFDGETWKTFNTENSILPSNIILSILIDENGTKWIGTDKGLVSFRGNALGTSHKQNPEVEFKLFPNPANDFITLKIPSDHMGSTVEIYNIQGKAVKSMRMTNNNDKIDISDLANGLYLIRLQTMDGVTVKKFVKKN